MQFVGDFSSYLTFLNLRSLELLGEVVQVIDKFAFDSEKLESPVCRTPRKGG